MKLEIGNEDLIDISGCDPVQLSDETFVAEALGRAADRLGLTPVSEPVVHKFPHPGGITGIVILAESHLAIHTWPELGLVSWNVFRCNEAAGVDSKQTLQLLLPLIPGTSIPTPLPCREAFLNRRATKMSGCVVSIIRETLKDERRVILRPIDIEEFTKRGFKVLVAESAGERIGYADKSYQAAGAVVVSQAEAWEAGNLVLKVKPPTAEEFGFLRRGAHYGAIFHAEGDPILTRALCESGVNAYSYEFFQDVEDEYPLAAPGAEIAGKLAIISAAYHLQIQNGGDGILLAHVPGARRARILVIGHGKAGGAATRLAVGMGARVRVVGQTPSRLRQFAGTIDPSIEVGVNSPQLLSEWVPWADVVIGAILVSTETTPPMIDEELLSRMRSGSLLIDVTCGYGRGFLPTIERHTSLNAPFYLRSGILQSKVDNLPSAVPQTSVSAFASVAGPHLLNLAEAIAGIDVDSSTPIRGRIICDGRISHPVLTDQMRCLAPDLLSEQ